MSEPEIRDFLRQRLAALLEIAEDDLDPGEDLAGYGLNSVQAVSLTGELEDHLGMSLDPTLIFAYPTIDALSAHLSTLP